MLQKRGFTCKDRRRCSRKRAKICQKLATILRVRRAPWPKFCKTSPFRNRVAKLRGPSEGLGGNAANVWSTQLQAVQQWNAMWYFHITSTRDIFRSERWRFSQIRIVLAVWKMQTPCCHVLVECVCLCVCVCVCVSSYPFFPFRIRIFLDFPRFFTRLFALISRRLRSFPYHSAAPFPDFLHT